MSQRSTTQLRLILNTPNSFTDMYSKGLVVFALLAALLVTTAALPTENLKQRDNILQKFLTRRDKVKDPAPSETRVERRAHLSEDEREIMTKQLMHTLSELMNSECMSDRDYQGWVDFGRRDAEMA